MSPLHSLLLAIASTVTAPSGLSTSIADSCGPSDLMTSHGPFHSGTSFEGDLTLTSIFYTGSVASQTSSGSISVCFAYLCCISSSLAANFALASSCASTHHSGIPLVKFSNAASSLSLPAGGLTSGLAYTHHSRAYLYTNTNGCHPSRVGRNLRPASTLARSSSTSLSGTATSIYHNPFMMIAFILSTSPLPW